MFEQIVVFGLVAACAAYSVWSLMPRALKRRLSAKSNGMLPAGNGGCGAGCDSCGSPGPAAKTVQWYGKKPASKG